MNEIFQGRALSCIEKWAQDRTSYFSGVSPTGETNKRDNAVNVERKLFETKRRV